MLTERFPNSPDKRPRTEMRTTARAEHGDTSQRHKEIFGKAGRENKVSLRARRGERLSTEIGNSLCSLVHPGHFNAVTVVDFERPCIQTTHQWRVSLS